MEYNRINWKNYPNTETPINETNLNIMDKGIYDMSIQVNGIDTGLQYNSERIDTIESKLYPVKLYENYEGTTETITLSQPYTDFSRIGVYAIGKYNNDSVYNEILTNINYMTLSCTSISDTNYNCTVWRTAYITFNGNQLNFVTNASSSYLNNTGYSVSTEDGLKIIMVVGYKY